MTATCRCAGFIGAKRSGIGRDAVSKPRGRAFEGPFSPAERPVHIIKGRVRRVLRRAKTRFRNRVAPRLHPILTPIRYADRRLTDSPSVARSADPTPRPPDKGAGDETRQKLRQTSRYARPNGRRRPSPCFAPTFRGAMVRDTQHTRQGKPPIGHQTLPIRCNC